MKRPHFHERRRVPWVIAEAPLFYMRRHAAACWDKVCDDGYVAVMDQQPAYVKFKPGADLSSLVISRENDCAHFVSRYIARLGGGLPISNRDGMALAILSVPVLVKYLRSSGIGAHH